MGQLNSFQNSKCVFIGLIASHDNQVSCDQAEHMRHIHFQLIRCKIKLYIQAAMGTPLYFQCLHIKFMHIRILYVF